MKRHKTPQPPPPSPPLTHTHTCGTLRFAACPPCSSNGRLSGSCEILMQLINKWRHCQFVWYCCSHHHVRGQRACNTEATSQFKCKSVVFLYTGRGEHGKFSTEGERERERVRISSVHVHVRGGKGHYSHTTLHDKAHIAATTPPSQPHTPTYSYYRWNTRIKQPQAKYNMTLNTYY